MRNIFNIDFAEFIQCLNNANVKYLLIGGYATIIHGYSRTTGDLDIWVERTSTNYKKIQKAFESFSMPVFDMTEDKFLTDDKIDVFTYGRPPVSIDIINRIKGIDFETAWKNKEIKNIDSIPVNLISLKDLITAKKAVSRPKDIDDIDHLT